MGIYAKYSGLIVNKEPLKDIKVVTMTKSSFALTKVRKASETQRDN